MDLSNITYKGPEYENASSIETFLPDNLRSLLKQVNGFIQFGGGLHVRGICNEPEWHSLEIVMKGEFALHYLFSEVKETDIPFAQDCVADQYLLRDQLVSKLHSETGEIESLNLGLPDFFSKISEDTQEFLGLGPLLKIHSEGKHLEPGQVIHVYPPFCTNEAANGVSLNPVSSIEALKYLSKLSSRLKSMPEGESFEFRIQQ